MRQICLNNHIHKKSHSLFFLHVCRVLYIFTISINYAKKKSLFICKDHFPVIQTVLEHSNTQINQLIKCIPTRSACNSERTPKDVFPESVIKNTLRIITLK